jgi:hypothetical protein
MMAIVDDYAAIAAELRRIRAEKPPDEDPAEVARELAPQHRMRTTIAGEQLYRRLVLRSRR